MSEITSDVANAVYHLAVLKLQQLTGKSVVAFGAMDFPIKNVYISEHFSTNSKIDQEHLTLNLNVYLDNYDCTVTTPRRSDGRNIPIYGDETFLSSIKQLMRKNKVKLFDAPATLNASTVEYSESGLQGTDYVNIDVMIAVEQK